MTDISTLIGRLLPLAVIGGLAAVFYLLDVFSVRPQFDAQATEKIAARKLTATAGRAADSPRQQRSDSFPAPPTGMAVPPPQPIPGSSSIGSENSFRAEGEFQSEGEIPETVTSPDGYPAQEDPMRGAAPRYVPPAGSAGQPLATDMINPADSPVQLPSDEILEEEGQRIENETIQAEQAASQGGDVEQEQ
jgi:hypothetical protein